MNLDNALKVIEALKSGKLTVKSFHPSCKSAKNGTISLVTKEGYRATFNVVLHRVRSLHSVETPKGQKWVESTGDGWTFKAGDQTFFTDLLSHSMEWDIKCEAIYRVTINGNPVGLMYNKGPTKDGMPFPVDAAKGWRNREKVEKLAAKFEAYWLKRRHQEEEQWKKKKTRRKRI